MDLPFAGQIVAPSVMSDIPGYLSPIDGIEFTRCPTNREWAAPRYFVASHLLDRPHGNRDLATDETVTMWFDSFEILYQDSVIAALPAAFSARPSLAYANGAYTVTPNVNASHIEYWWYVNGAPIVAASGASFTMAQASGVQVQVKAKSLRDQPEAWTART